MGNKQWIIRNYKEEYDNTKYQLELLRDFLEFLEEEYLPKSIGELQKEFEIWYDAIPNSNE